MGLSQATLNGNRVTRVRVNLPAWGVWYADVSVDGEFTITGAVTLQVADLTLTGTVVSGGPSKGRSYFRVVGGAGGWGKSIPAKSYTNDAGVKTWTVLNDAAVAVGETLDALTVPSSLRCGPGFARKGGAAKRLLEQLSPSSWYVGEDGVTRLGARPASTYSGTAARSAVDLARGTLTLASETIANLLPGVTVDGLEAVDVEHEMSPAGLRTTIWGKQQSGTSRRLAAMREIFEQLDPNRLYRGVYEYRVVTQSGDRLNLQPVRVSTGMPDLRNVQVRPGVPGCRADVQLGSRVLVAFVDGDPGRPVVTSFEEWDGEGFDPSTLKFEAGGQAATEHVLTVEALTVILHNVLVGVGALATPPALLGSGIINGIISAALAASNTPPAPPGIAAQLAASPAQVSAMLTGPGTSCAPYAPAIASALAAKIPNESGLFPSIGAAKVKAG
jgi:hypothetical protein